MKRSERGFTLVEIMIVVAIIALLAAIAIPNVLRGRATANESAAIGNIRALVSSLEMYRSVYQVYPTTWQTDMYDPTPAFGPPSFDQDLTTAVQGYDYDYAVGGGGSTYTIEVDPVTIGSNGTRSFFADESGLIRHCSSVSGQTPDAGDNTIDTQPANCN